jgi:hypothetical protein
MILTFTGFEAMLCIAAFLACAFSCAERSAKAVTKLHKIFFASGAIGWLIVAAGAGSQLL